MHLSVCNKVENFSFFGVTAGSRIIAQDTNYYTLCLQADQLTEEQIAGKYY